MSAQIKIPPGNEVVFLLAQQREQYPLTWEHHTIKPGGRFTIGSSAECDVEIRSASAAKRHCAIELRDGALWLLDFASFCGTWLNGERITEAQPLATGDKLSAGDRSFYISSVEAQVVPKELLLTCLQSTDADILWSLARQRWEFSRGVAQNIHSSEELLSWLANAPDLQTRQMVARNPSTPPSALLYLLRDFAEEVVENPAFDLVLLERPELFLSLPFSVPFAWREHTNPKLRRLAAMKSG